MQLEVTIMPTDFMFVEETWYTHKESNMSSSKKPLLSVIWLQDNGSYIEQISTIENIFNPIQEDVTIPEKVRQEVINKYGDKLKQYYQEDNQ